MNIRVLPCLICFALIVASFAADMKPSTKGTFRCPDFCTELNNPVCAKNSYCFAAFGNPCKLDLYNCRRKKKDYFVPVSPKNCNSFVTPNFLYCL